MAFNINNTNNRVGYRSGKRFFLIILIINSLLGCIYIIHEQKGKVFDAEETTTTRPTHGIFQPQIGANQPAIFLSNIFPKPFAPDDSIKIYPNIPKDNILDQNKISTKISNDIFQHPEQSSNAIKFIKDTLAMEYNPDDLNKFYDHVQNEYSLGLKCTRPQSFLDMLTNKKVSSPSISNAKYLRPSPFHRTELNNFLIDQSHACSNEAVDLLIIVISKSDNYKTRDAIRRTWGSRKKIDAFSSIKIKFFFLIDFNENFSRNIRLENDLFHDIIQVELLQQYTLVTQRVLSLFEWSFRYCRQAKYLFKTDDDVFINLVLLLKFVSPLIQKQINNSFLISDMDMYGYKHENPPAYRHTEDEVLARYAITYDEFPCERYPTFLSGFGYVISKKARDAILYTAYQDPDPFRLSDVYLAGIIPNYLSITLQSLSNFHIRYEGDCDLFFNDSKAFACATPFHHGAANDVFAKYNFLWQSIKRNINIFIN